jgi:2-polyprenyl-6-methoxyphenol hydroxylase-like FAD-dependent oxidoreductase
MTIRNVLIVGGGIAGLTAATALARCGVSVEVVELYGRPLGAGITLLHRAIDGLHEIGVLDRFIEHGVQRGPSDVWFYYDRAGDPLPTAPLPPAPAMELPAGILIARPTMARILQDAATGAGATIRTGVGLQGLEQSADSVTATLTDGSERSYDLVVGADGIRSTTRSLIMRDEVVPRYSGITMFRWLISDIPDVGPVGFYQHERTLVVLMRLRDGRIYLATGRAYGDRPGRIEPDEARRIVREHLGLFTAPLLAELRRHLTDDVELLVNDYDWLLAPNPWYRGRVLLIGDAAHSTTANLGYGGGMAIEDGAVLGQEVAAGGATEEVLERFMKRRFERARLVVNTSVELGDMLFRGDPVADQNALRARALEALAAPY